VPALRAEFTAQALALRRTVPGTGTIVIVSCRARTVLFQTVLVPAHRASAKWPPIPGSKRDSQSILKLFKDGAVPRLGSGATSPKNCPSQDRARARGRPAPLSPPLAASRPRWSPVAPSPGHGVTPFLASPASSLSSVPRAVWSTGWRPFLSLFLYCQSFPDAIVPPSLAFRFTQ
jgi:hypothetical protein